MACELRLQSEKFVKISFTVGPVGIRKKGVSYKRPGRDFDGCGRLRGRHGSNCRGVSCGRRIWRCLRDCDGTFFRQRNRNRDRTLGKRGVFRLSEIRRKLIVSGYGGREKFPRRQDV